MLKPSISMAVTVPLSANPFPLLNYLAPVITCVLQLINFNNKNKQKIQVKWKKIVQGRGTTFLWYLALVLSTKRKLSVE